MATSFLKSFMEAVNPAAGKAAQKARDPQSRKTERKTQPEAEANVLLSEALEERSSRPEIIVVPQAEQVLQMDDVNILEIPADKVSPKDLLECIIVRRHIPVESDEESSTDPDPILTTIDEMGSGAVDITGDAKLFQEAATEYQLAYQSLDKKYSEQAVLVHEASEALKASQSHVEELQKEMDALKQNRDSDIQLAVGGMYYSTSNISHQSSPDLKPNKQLLLSSRDKSRCFRSHYQARGIYLQCLQWVQLEKVKTSGPNFQLHPWHCEH